MEINPAIGVAQSLQGRIGQTISLVQNQMAPEQRAGVLLQAGTTSIGTAVLTGMKAVQEKSLEKLDKVCELLYTQVEIQKEKDRREREAARELEKEKAGQFMPTQELPVDESTPKEKKGLGKLLEGVDLADLLTLGIASTLAASGGAKAVAKKIGGRLIKGGIYGIIASAIAGPVVDIFTGPAGFNIDLDEEQKKGIENGVIGAVTAGAMFGPLGAITGAVVGWSGSAIAEATKYITGQIEASEIKDPEATFGKTALGLSAATMFTSATLGAKFVAAGGTLATIGGAMVSLPVILGAGIAVALGVGVGYLINKAEAFEDETLKRAVNFTKQLDKDLGMWAAKQKEGILENLGINFGDMSTLGLTRTASKAASKQYTDGGAGEIDEGERAGLIQMINGLTNFNDEALLAVMQDRSKANNFFRSIEDLKMLAVKGDVFGEQSQTLFENLSFLSDRAQTVAIQAVKDGMKGGVLQNVASNRLGYSQDDMEKIAGLQHSVNLSVQQYEKKRMQVDKQRIMLEQAKAAQAAGNKGDFDEAMSFLSNIFRTSDVGKIEGQLFNTERALSRTKNKLDKRLVELNNMGVGNYTMDDLLKLYSSETDKERLRTIIEEVTRKSGQTMSQLTKQSIDDAVNKTVIINPSNNSISNVKSNTYMSKGKLNSTVDNNKDMGLNMEFGYSTPGHN
tara:strand:+ start:3048 stop:5087 length:2040 start_codon:yes stop_codon:yes gene_type:complete